MRINSITNPDSSLKRGLTWSLALIALCLMVATGWVWWQWFSPWGYHKPPNTAPVTPGTHQVFVYGTLRHAPVRLVVTGAVTDTEPATLVGYRRCGLNIAPATETRVDGEVFRVSAAELARLDHYERLGVRYTRHKVTLADHGRAWVYRRLDDRRDSRVPIGCRGSDTMSGRTRHPPSTDTHQGARQ